MKTPEEIKKGLERCSSIANCADGCPYHVTVEGSYGCEEMGCEDGLLPDALALIRQLEAQVPRWISVEERLPEDEKDVAVIVKLRKGNWMYLTAFRLPYGGWWINRGSGLDYAEVTHWMPLPEPPET